MLCHAVLCCVGHHHPQVGKDLTDVYWRPGNGAMFLDLVQQLTGKPLAADAWVARLQRDTGALLVLEKEQYEAAVKAGPKFKPGSEIDIGMRVRLVEADEVIADSESDGGFVGACSKFKDWVRAKYFGSNGGAAVAQE